MLSFAKMEQICGAAVAQWVELVCELDLAPVSPEAPQGETATSRDLTDKPKRNEIKRTDSF